MYRLPSLFFRVRRSLDSVVGWLDGGEGSFNGGSRRSGGIILLPV